MSRLCALHVHQAHSKESRAAPIKRTAVERQVNVQIVFLFILLLALSIGSTVGASIRTWFFSSQQWYLLETNSLTGRGSYFLSIYILPY